jgi:hypothetical protein
MAGQFLRAATSCVCAYCGEPLAMAAQGMKAWRVSDQFVCNEFCADGISPPVPAPIWERLYPSGLRKAS